MTQCSLVGVYRRFRRNVLPPSTGPKSKPSDQQVEVLLAYSDYSLVLKMEAEHSSETGFGVNSPHLQKWEGGYS
jgi:hypothetical protein